MSNFPAIYVSLLVFSLLLFIVITTIFVRSGRASIFHPATVYLAFHFITFVLRPFFSYFGNYTNIYEVYRFNPSWSDKITALLGANLGLVVFVLAALAFGNAKPQFRPASDAALARYTVPLLITCAIVLPLGIMSFRTVFSGADLYQLDQATGVTISVGANGYLLSAQLMLATMTGMIAYIFRLRWWSLFPVALFVIFRAGTGGRGPFIAAIFFLLLLYLYKSRARWLTLPSALIATVGVLLFRLVGDDRGGSIQALLGFKPVEVSTEKLRFLESMDWANLDFFEFLVYTVPQRTGTYDYMVSLLQLITEPIPRALWSGKPIGAPVKLFNLFDYGYPIGITYSLPGAGWFELGWGGIIILCVAFAWIYGRAYNRFMLGSQSPFAVMLYCAFLATSVVAFRDGQVMSIMKQALFYLAPIFIMQLIARGYNQVDPGVRTRESASDILPQTVPLAKTPRERRRERAKAAVQA